MIALRKWPERARHGCVPPLSCMPWWPWGWCLCWKDEWEGCAAELAGERKRDVDQEAFGLGPCGSCGTGAPSLLERSLSPTGTQFCCPSGRQAGTPSAAQQRGAAPQARVGSPAAWRGLARAGWGVGACFCGCSCSQAGILSFRAILKLPGLLLPPPAVPRRDLPFSSGHLLGRRGRHKGEPALPPLLPKQGRIQPLCVDDHA